MLYWLFVVIHIVILIHICQAKRDDPASATFWLLVVTLIPMGGIVLYLLFGITRVDRADWVIRAFRKNFIEDEINFTRLPRNMLLRESVVFSPPSQISANEMNITLDRLFPDTIPLSGNKLELLADGSTVYPRMLEDIQSAKATIRLQSFIFISDMTGTAMLKALRQKALEGVDVKILFDSFGSFKSYFSPFFWRCLCSRIPCFKMQAFSMLNLLTPWRFQLRNHRKLLLIDGRIAYSGGINIADANARQSRVPPNRLIHDLHCRILGPAISCFTASFFRDWCYTTRQTPSDSLHPADLEPPQWAGNSTLRVIASGPGDQYQGTRRLFFAAAALARRSLVIITPYMVPGAPYIDALCMAAARGVDVKIIVPHRNNHFYVDLAARNFYPMLLKSGVRIFEKNGLFSHTKALLADSEWGFMGSSNCDSRSFNLNFELDFCYEGGEYVKSMREQVQSELDSSTELYMSQVAQWSWPIRFISSCCALISPIL